MCLPDAEPREYSSEKRHRKHCHCAWATARRIGLTSSCFQRKVAKWIRSRLHEICARMGLWKLSTCLAGQGLQANGRGAGLCERRVKRGKMLRENSMKRLGPGGARRPEDSSFRGKCRDLGRNSPKRGEGGWDRCAPRLIRES